MKFLILASLFVLSVVAEPEAEPQHHTAGFTAYTNGALVPEDTDSVKAAKIQHLTAKAALYAQPMPLKYYQPQVYGVQHQQLIQVPRVGVYGHHVYQPHVYGLPALRHFGKREAEAEPEAEAEAEAQYMNYYGTPATTYPVTYGYPAMKTYTGYPAMKTYTGYPAIKTYMGYPAIKTYTGYPATTAYTGYPITTAYAGYPATTAYKGYPHVYGLPALRHFGKREAEAEPEAEAEAEAQYMNYYGTPATTYPVTYGYPSIYTGYPAMKTHTGYPATTAYTGYPITTAYTGYPATTVYKGYPYTYNTLPTTTFSTAYNRYPYTYGTYGYNPYKIVQTPVVKN